MDFNSLFEKWKRIIIAWKTDLYEYIKSIDEIGKYRLLDKWDYINDNIQNIQEISSNSISDIDKSESYFILLNEIINKLSEVFDIPINIKKYQEASHKIYVKLQEIIDIKEKVQGFNHGLLITKIHIKQLVESNKGFLVQKYKYNSLSNYDKKYYIIKEDLPVVQKINYLIKPLTITERKPNCIEVINNIVYNVMPLISKKESHIFGPILANHHGLTQQIIKRFNTINYVNTFTDIDLQTMDSFTKEPLCLFNGSIFSKLMPANYNPGINWKPLSGIHPIVYLTNKNMEDKILEKMILNNDKYQVFNTLTFNQIISPDLMLSEIRINPNVNIEVIAAKHCFNILKLSINSLRMNESLLAVIKKELQMLQYQNLLSIIENIKKKQINEINIMPIKYIMYYLKLI